MGCPTCGSTRSRAIAPGYVECAGTVRVDRAAPVPGGLYVYDEPCRTRYQQASDTSQATTGVCACGTFAVRACRSCSSALCGDHGTRVKQLDGEVWWCSRCVKAREDHRQREALDRRREEYERVRALPRGGVAELLSMYEREGAVKDGATHQFLDLTNQEVAEFLFDLVPDPGSFIELPGDDIRVYADGTRRLVRAGSQSMTDGSLAYTPNVDKVIGRAEDRFQDQPAITDPDFPELLYRDRVDRPYATVDAFIRQARAGIPALANVRSAHRRASNGQAGRLAVSLVSALLTLVCVIAAVDILRTATDTQSQNPAIGLFVGALILSGVSLGAGSSWATRR